MAEVARRCCWAMRLLDLHSCSQSLQHSIWAKIFRCHYRSRMASHMTIHLFQRIAYNTKRCVRSRQLVLTLGRPPRSGRQKSCPIVSTQARREFTPSICLGRSRSRSTFCCTSMRNCSCSKCIAGSAAGTRSTFAFCTAILGKVSAYRAFKLALPLHLTLCSRAQKSLIRG